MRISDWSSDVCSSDLGGCIPVGRLGAEQIGQYLHGGALALEAGGHGLVERRRHALAPEAAHRVDHIMPLHHSQIGRATSELQSLMRISYAVFCLKKKNKITHMLLTKL